MLNVKASAPVRIDLAGGWSDIEYFTKKHTGTVVNIAINKRANAELNIDENGKINVNYNCDVPIGTGLGTSSAINVALLSCINHSTFSPEKSAELAHRFEALLGGPVGRQDQWSSSFGGALHLKFEKEHVKILPFNPKNSAIKWLEEHLILAHTKIPHISGEVHTPIWERFNKGDSIIINSIKKLEKLADKMAKALIEDNRENIVEILNEVTKTTDLLSPSINQPVRLFCNNLMNENLALAWKIMGAGGGGVVGILSNKNKIVETKGRCEKEGWTIIDWEMETKGVILEKVKK